MRKLIAVALLLVMTSVAADGTLLDAVKAEAAKPKVTWTLPYDWKCFQPGVVDMAVHLIEWQRQRIAELERQCGDRCSK